MVLTPSCMQDWQIPMLFNICRAHNCTQLHSWKTSHSLWFQVLLSFSFLPAFPSSPVFSKTRSVGRTVKWFLSMLSEHLKGSHQQHCPTVTTTPNKQKPYHKECQPWSRVGAIEETAGGCKGHRKPKVTAVLLAKRVSGDTGQQLLSYCQPVAGTAAGASDPPNWKGSCATVTIGSFCVTAAVTATDLSSVSVYLQPQSFFQRTF